VKPSQQDQGGKRGGREFIFKRNSVEGKDNRRDIASSPLALFKALSNTRGGIISSKKEETEAVMDRTRGAQIREKGSPQRFS